MTQPITCPHCGHSIRPNKAEILTYGNVTLYVDLGYLEIENLGKRALTPCETRILAQLMRFPEQLCTREHLFQVNNRWEIQDGCLSVEVYRIRKKLRGSDLTIVTRTGEGYFLSVNGPAFSTYRCATEEQKEKAVELVKQGYSYVWIAKELNISHITVKKAALRAGIIRDPKGKRDGVMPLTAAQRGLLFTNKFKL